VDAEAAQYGQAIRQTTRERVAAYFRKAEASVTALKQAIEADV
jgi:hypothetical protein